MIIKNAKIYGEELLDLRIEGGKIVEMGENLRGEGVLDVEGLTLLPSFVDLCVNLKNDKFNLSHLDLLEKECLKGGIGAILLRDKMRFDEEAFALFLQNCAQKKLRIFSSIKVDSKPRNIATLMREGAVALELESAQDANTLKMAMHYALMKKAPIFVRCYDEGFDDGGVMNDCALSFELGLAGMSGVAESSEVAKMKEVAEFYKGAVVYDGISLEKSLSLLDGESVLVGIHHLIKDESACAGFNTSAKLMPPLRSSGDRNFLQEALKRGKIRFLSAMHSPKSVALKDLAFDEAAFGIHSICEYVSLCATFLVRSGLLSWRELCEITSFNGAHFLGLDSGRIELGREANLIVLDEGARLRPYPSCLYAGDELFGKLKFHILRGELLKL